MLVHGLQKAGVVLGQALADGAGGVGGADDAVLVGGKKHLGRGRGAGGNVVKQVGLARKRQADGLGQVLYQ